MVPRIRLVLVSPLREVINATSEFLRVCLFKCLPFHTAYIGNAMAQQSAAANVIVHARHQFKELLIQYKKENNGLLPEHIIYYRDGVSEGEFEAIRLNEGIELHRLCEASRTKITIIVAIKRHHTRFFAEGGLATKLG